MLTSLRGSSKQKISRNVPQPLRAQAEPLLMDLIKTNVWGVWGPSMDSYWTGVFDMGSPEKTKNWQFCPYVLFFLALILQD